jgi:hypothetical protein
LYDFITKNKENNYTLLKYQATMQDERKRTEGNNNMTKNIKVDEAVHRDLGEIGKLSESYNDVIRRLIDHYMKTVAHSGTKRH